MNCTYTESVLVISKHIAVPFHKLFPSGQQVHRLFSVQRSPAFSFRDPDVHICICGGGWSGSGRSDIAITVHPSRRTRVLIVGDICCIVSVTDVRIIHLHEDTAGLGGYLEEALLQSGRGLIA